MQLLILAFWLTIVNSAFQQDLLDVPSTETIHFRIPQNAQEGDELFADRQIRINKKSDESINLQLEGRNPSAIAINRSLLDPGQLVQFILVNKNVLQNENSKVKLQAIGVISGKLEELNLEFNIDNNYNLPIIHSDIPTFLIQNDFETAETTIIKTTSQIPKNTDIELIGKNSGRFRASFQDDNVFLETLPCKDNEQCNIVYPFSLILRFKNGENHADYLVNFDQDKKRVLKMDQKRYETDIEEHTGKQIKLLKVEARGNVSEIIYSLRDSSGLFSIHPKEGILSILHPEFLTISSFGKSVELTAIATDDQNSANAIVQVNISPKIEESVVFGFEKDHYSINSEINSTDRKIGNIAAKADTPLIYRIIEGRSDLYDVHQNGDIDYIGDILKDDRSDRLVVVVQEMDGGLKLSSSEVRINLKGIGSHPIRSLDDADYIDIISNDDAPGIVVSSFTFEDKDPDAKMEFEMKIVEVADREGNLQDAENLDLFELKSDPDNYQAHVIIGKDLKMSNLTNIKIETIARDIAHSKEPPMIVSRRIIVENSNTDDTSGKHFDIVKLPPFITLPEDSPIGSFVYKPVVTLPKNVTFSIEPKQLFDILSDGTITTKKELKNEKKNESNRIPFTVGVESKDGVRKSAECSIMLMKKARAHFIESEYSASLPRGIPSGTIVALVSAIDANGEPIHDDFSLRGTHSQLFDIDKQGTIKTNEQLSQSSLKDISFMVAIASDLSVSVPVHLTLEDLSNDNIRLVENEIFASVYDNLPVNSFVSKLEVVGDQKVKFSLSSNEGKISDLFYIDENGTIRNSDFLIGVAGMHKMSILASSVGPSGVRSTNATLIVDVLKSNECSPRPKDKGNLVFNVRENMPEDTIIGKVVADPLPKKCQIQFSLWDYSKKKAVFENDIVKIDQNSGELRTVKGFDYEKKKSYTIFVELSTIGNMKTISTAELQILDDDDHKVHFDQPIQNVEVAEDTAPSTVITTVRAEEGDNQNIYYHLSPSSSPQFSLHSTTGRVILEQQLDREAQDEYLIEIGASNNPKAEQSEWITSMKLVVKVKDVNDNVPQFEKSNYEAVVDKDVVVGTNLIQIHASDPDSEDKEKTLEYSITQTSFEYRGMSRNVEELFDVHSTDGDVYNLRSLKDYVGGVFHVSLQVRDPMDGTIGKGRLNIYVHDRSDVLVMELPYKPVEMTPQIVQEFRSQLSNSTSLVVLGKKIVYRSSHGITSPNSVDLQLVFFNKTASEVIPAEKVLAVCEKINMNGIPQIRKLSSETASIALTAPQSWIQPQLLIIAIAFLVILTILLVLCALIMCYYRNRYQNDKRAIQNDAAIKDALNGPVSRSPALISFKHYPSPAIPEMARPIPNGDQHVYRSKKMDDNLASYAVQQATITVPEHEEKI